MRCQLTSLVSQIDFKQSATPRMTTGKSYDRLKRLMNIRSTPATAGQAAFGFAYQYNQANQRTSVTLGAGTFWNYEYDILGQVTFA